MNRQTIHVFAFSFQVFQDQVNRALDVGYKPMFRATISDGPNYSVFMEMEYVAWEKYKQTLPKQL